MSAGWKIAPFPGVSATATIRPPDGRSIFAWAGCEYRDFLAIRRHFRVDRGLMREQHLAVAYWRRGYREDDARSGRPKISKTQPPGVQPYTKSA
ncbi:MAG: SIP domain-containing protein [Rhizobiaceae bacterium]